MRGQSESTKELIQYARRLLEADHPQTLRQLHYAIFSRREIDYENDQAHYKRLSRATTTARRQYRSLELLFPGEDVSGCNPYLIPPSWMADETREPETVSVWNDAAAYIETVKRSYRRDNWQDQPYRVEVWSEKATILGAIRPVAEEWGVTLRISHGFGSTGMEQQIGEFFASMEEGKRIEVFFLGDHDPSGHIIEQDIHRRVMAASGRQFDVKRLAIHGSDIREFNLPPQRIKANDSRAAGFRQRFGSDAATVELDALPAAELRRRVEAAISGRVDFERWERQIAVQEVEYNSIAAFAERVKSLPQLVDSTETPRQG
jgi:hypothetical protein